MFTENEIKKIKEKLPDSWVQLIHEQAGVSPSTIRKYFNGGKIRSYLVMDVMKGALSVIEQNKKTASSIKEKFSSIISN